MPTIFDKIIRREIPADIVYEDSQILAFRDINPQAPEHILVIPKNRVETFTELADRDERSVGELFCGAAKVATKLGLGEDGYRIVVNCGTHGQQTVDYLHVHILGGRQMRWPPG